MSEELLQEYRGLGLPEWVILAINSYAYEAGHAYGQGEIDLVASDILENLKTTYRNDR